MPQRNAALTYLPDATITVNSDTFPTRSLKAGLNKVAIMQAEETPTATYTDVICLSDSPFVTVVWDIDVTAPANATGTVTVATPLANDTVTINGLVYTAVAGVKADNTEFSIDGTDTETATDLAASVNADTRTGTLGDVSATSAAAVVTLTQYVVKGAAGDPTTLASSGGTLTVSGATFSGGITFGTYDLTFSAEDYTTISTINRPALSTRRSVTLSVVAGGEVYTVRSVLAALNLVEKFEDAVASTGSGATGDGVFTDLIARGPTPFETYVWDITKSGATYTLTATANS